MNFTLKPADPFPHVSETMREEAAFHAQALRLRTVMGVRGAMKRAAIAEIERVTGQKMDWKAARKWIKRYGRPQS